MEDNCVKTIKSENEEMSVDLCSMLEDCKCGGENCCSRKEKK